MIVKFRDERRGNYIHMRVFVGKDEDHFQLAGKLVMDVGEWQLFGAALLLGAERTKGHLIVQHPDDQEIVEGGLEGREEI